MLNSGEKPNFWGRLGFIITFPYTNEQKIHPAPLYYSSDNNHLVRRLLHLRLQLLGLPRSGPGVGTCDFCSILPMHVRQCYVCSEAPLEQSDLVMKEQYETGENFNSQNFKEAPMCPQCKVSLRMRQKHCKICQRCVRTFDHHCTALGSCIGEFNRPYFLLLLVSAQFELTLLLVPTVWHQVTQERTGAGIAVISVLLLPMFICLILLGYHAWLMLANMTTYEMLKARKIWYIMPDQQAENQGKGAKDQQNVFRQSVWVNLYMYWSALWRRDPIPWEKYYKLAA